jgi:hypothetical protein
VNVGVPPFLPGFEEAVIARLRLDGRRLPGGIRAERGLAMEPIKSRIARRRAEEEGVDTLFRRRATTKSVASGRDPR